MLKLLLLLLQSLRRKNVVAREQNRTIRRMIQLETMPIGEHLTRKKINVLAIRRQKTS